MQLDQAAELQVKDNCNGRTPLWRAAENGHEAVVKLLLEQGAELESKDRYGRMTLWGAAEKGHEEVVKLVVEQGAEQESKDRYDGTTPMGGAWEDGEEVGK